MAFKIDRDRYEKIRERNDTLCLEVARLHGLPDRFLGRALLKIGRDAREDAPDALGNPAAGGYEVMLVWGVIPRLASRLGEDRLLPAEEAFARSLKTDPAEFRELVGQCMANHNFRALAKDDTSLPLMLLEREFVNGNPVTTALDRVHPPAPDSNDWIARHMREISRARFGHEEHDAWSPAFQDYKSKGLDFGNAVDLFAEKEDDLEP